MLENFIRSAKPPTISAGVMIAKVIWKLANTDSGMSPAIAPSVTPAKKLLPRPPQNALPSPKAML